jgi:ABC-2 type transport system ATP-binding protein
MMKIITSFIPATKGDVSVNGYDVVTQSMDSRRLIGYLPEHNPLYLEMYVKEYLSFIAGIYKLDKVSHRVNEMIERVGLGLEAHKRIGALSKGYRQRVGLAQALIHDPAVLILDEPTSGLDPNQLIEIRNLIQSVGQEKTVMFSTHIMQEVEAICSRALIVNRGKLIADQSIQDLKQNSGINRIYIELDGPVNENTLRSISGVIKVNSVGALKWELDVQAGIDNRIDIAKRMNEEGRVVLTMNQKEQRLEDIFKDLTITEK